MSERYGSPSERQDDLRPPGLEFLILCLNEGQVNHHIHLTEVLLARFSLHYLQSHVKHQPFPNKDPTLNQRPNIKTALDKRIVFREGDHSFEFELLNLFRRFGSRRILIGAGVLNAVCACICAASPNIVILLIARFFMANFLSGKSNCGYVLGEFFKLLSNSYKLINSLI